VEGVAGYPTTSPQTPATNLRERERERETERETEREMERERTGERERGRKSERERERTYTICRVQSWTVQGSGLTVQRLGNCPPLGLS